MRTYAHVTQHIRRERAELRSGTATGLTLTLSSLASSHIHTVHTHIHIRDTSGHVHIHSREAEGVPRTTPPLPHKHARVPTAVPNTQTTNADGALCRRSAQQQLRRDGPHPAPPGCKPSARAALLPWLALSPCRRLVSPAWGRGRCSLPRSQSYSRTRCRSVRGRDDPPLPSLPRLSPLRVPPRAVPSR